MFSFFVSYLAGTNNWTLQFQLGQTALHLAVGYNKIISVKTLIELGANIDVVDFNGNTPLHWALQNGFNEIVHYFVKVCKQNMNVKWFSEDSRKQAYGIADSYENQHQHSSIQGSDDKDLIQL
ncbi:uncharacterized protein [Dysidea avara]|uniref:uncharacterized protein n=1 Tax=Dysidea avara TaxID=196820 RepID=UPI00333321C0